MLFKILDKTTIKDIIETVGEIWMLTILNNSIVSVLTFPKVIVVVMQENALRQIYAEVFSDEVLWCLQVTCMHIVQQKKEGGKKEERKERDQQW